MAFKSKSAYLRTTFPAAQIAAMYRQLNRTDYTYPLALFLLTGYGGAVNDVPSDATAVPQRDSVFKLQAAAVWNHGDDETAHGQWVREAYRDIHAATGGVPVLDDVNDGIYINYKGSNALNATRPPPRSRRE
jgi:hypothetical protein